MVKVLNPGFYSTIQDFGRFDSQQYGVPYSGVLDRYSAGIANYILGNKEGVAVIEMTMTGVELQFYCDTAICISGADMSPQLNKRPTQLNKYLLIKNGDVLSFGKLKIGFRCYLAVLGGFVTENVLGSQSMLSGVTKKFKLFKNDEINISIINSFTNDKNASIKVNNKQFSVKELNVFKGPEFDFLSKELQNSLLKQDFTISKDNNRMAYQLEENLENSLESIITSGVLPGTVQLTPSGKLIILMRDCQTTGGYPRVLQLKESVINILAQKFAGSSISFKLI